MPNHTHARPRLFRFLPAPRLRRASGILALGLATVGLAQTQPTWSIVPHGLGSGYSDFTSIVFGNGVFVTTSVVANGALRYATSPDGLTWTARTLNAGLSTPGYSRVRFLNGRFIIMSAGFTGSGTTTARAGFVHTSTDGVTWTNLAYAEASSFAELIFVNGRYYSAAGSTIASSADLTTWTAHPTPLAGIYSYLDIAYGGGRWFATTNGAGGVVTSTDGSTWTQVPFFSQLGGYRVEYLDGTWFFYSQGNNAVSTDGTTFTTVTRANTTPGGTATILAINGRYLAPGPGYFLAGLDGRNWAQFGLWPTITGALFASYNEMAFGAGRYVTAGNVFGGASAGGNIITLAESTAPALTFPVPPSITTAPLATNAVLGRSATFSVAAAGGGNTDQWRKDNSAIAGATAATYTIATVTAASAGNYAVRITNSLGTTTSTPVALTLIPAAFAGRLANMSIRTGAGTGDNTLIVGLGLGGAATSGPKAVLARAIGPTLGAFGVGGALADPVMTVLQGQSTVATNDDWSGAFDFGSVGAFALAGTPIRDSAIYNPALAPNSYSIQIVGKNNGTGIALAEIYDATPSASFTATTPRLVNVSARTQVGTGDNILIAGFAVGGQSSVRVLIRAVGPTLGTFGVGGALLDPKLEIYSGSTKINENDNWGSPASGAAGTAELKAAFTSVAAFAFANDTSRDAALVATLAPGTYTAQISGIGNTTGVALVEIYELP
ncbi:MAG: hypothetical protein HZA93_12505 [Verrucomicrobia bacterium]|nr:hypothetical protein [Verrucomicrobiota bacterium]